MKLDTQPKQLEEVAINNERSLLTLTRAIKLSQGQFSLILIHCNYDVLREEILKSSQQLPIIIDTVTLPEFGQTPYNTIRLALGNTQPAALMVFGLECVQDLDAVLASVNCVRDEFRKNFPFPMLFWVNDQVIQKLMRLAPDFVSWATTIKFTLSTPKLLHFLQQETDSLFATVLPTDAAQHQPHQVAKHYSTVEQAWKNSYELHLAIRELQNRGITLEPELDASLQFLFGVDDYVSNRINKALNNFQQSFQVWQQLSESNDAKINNPKIPSSGNTEELDIVSNHT